MIRVVAGTYEGLLYGWELDVAKATQAKRSEKKETNMKLIFGYSAHSECIKSVALNAAKQGKMLLSGSSDEMIKIYNVDKRVEVGTLMEQTGSISCVAFHGATHMLSGSTDNTICIWRVSDWNCLHILGGHKGEINAIAIHPSGKLALSVARDRTLRMWNLVKGRSAYIRRLDFEANLVEMSSQGTRYVLGFGQELNVFNSTNAECVGTLQHAQKIHCAAFLREDYVVCAGEDRYVYVWKATGKLVAKVTHDAIKTRIRCLQVLQVDTNWLLVTATSDGLVHVWDANELDLQEKEDHASVDQSDSVLPIATTNLGVRKVRLTCLSSCNASAPVEPRTQIEEQPDDNQEQALKAKTEASQKTNKRQQEEKSASKPEVAPRVVVEMQSDEDKATQPKPSKKPKPAKSKANAPQAAPPSNTKKSTNKRQRRK